MNEELIELLNKDLNTPHNARTSKSHIKKHYPKIFNYINNRHVAGQVFSGHLYCLKHNINYPKCEYCGSYKKFISFKRGFLKYCDNKCEKHFFVNELYPQYLFKKVDTDKNIEIYYKGEKLTKLTTKKFKTLLRNNVDVFCKESSQDIINSGIIPNNSDFYYNKFYKTQNKREYIDEQYVKDYSPYTYNLILDYTKKYKNINFKLRHKLYLDKNTPVCKICGSYDVIRKNTINNYCETCKRKKSAKYNKYKFVHEYWNNYIKNNFSIPNNLKLYIGKKRIRLNNYCEHSQNIIIPKHKIKKYKKHNINYLCTECLKLSILNLNYEIDKNLIKNSWQHIKNCSEKNLLLFNPEIWNSIYKTSQLYKNCTFVEAKFMLNNDIANPPVCIENNCENRSIFSKEAYNYLYHCNVHLYNYTSSIGEKEILDFITYNYKKDVFSNYREFDNQELDIYIPDLKLGIEFNGLYWHNEYFKDKYAHINKFKFFKDKNIQLITIWEDDWIMKNDIVKSIILNKLRLNKRALNARDCKIKNVEYKAVKSFLDDNHIQGNANASIRLGLFYNDELVSLMTFGAKRKVLGQKAENNSYEMLRFCNKNYTSVRGSASKLFKYFIRNYSPINIVSYANLDISDGKLYNILGFENKGYTDVNYWWAKGSKRNHRSNFMKHKLVKEGADPNKTENEIMREKGYFKIYGNGNLKFIYS